MTNHAGYAVEHEDGVRETVYNFATARYLVETGYAQRVYDNYFDRYIIVELPEDSL